MEISSLKYANDNQKSHKFSDIFYHLDYSFPSLIHYFSYFWIDFDKKFNCI